VQPLLLVEATRVEVGLHGLLRRPGAHLEVADLQERAHVARLDLQDALVLRDRAVELVLRGVPLRCLGDLLAVDGHDRTTAPRRG
jgi:hypothetical protein